MIDAHAHLDSLDDPSAALARARDAGVHGVVAIGVGVASARASLAIAAAEQDVVVAAGIHPHDAGDGAPLDDLRALLAEEKAVAIGEIGLDYFRDHAPRDAQRRVFAAQLDLATELDLPVVIHTRAADEDTAAVLADFGGTVVLHCFSSPHLLPVALERGYYVSFAGNVTFPKATDLRLAATQVPADRLLAETDAPYLAPQPVRGRPNEPANVMHTLATLAQTRGESPAALERQIEENAERVFGLAVGA